jgi:hypothetical protein
MRELKNKIDVYFDLDGDAVGQVMYYSVIGFMFFVMFLTTIFGLLV